MALLLKYTRCFRLSPVHIIQTRFNSVKKGIVIGVYSEKGKQGFGLSTNAAKYNTIHGGKICETLNFIDQHVEPGKALLFWNVIPCYTAIAIVGLGKKLKGFNKQERINEDKENVRIAASAGCRALQDIGISKIEVDDMDDPEAAGEGSTLGLWKFQECKRVQQVPSEVSLLKVTENDGLTNSWNFGVSKANAQNFARRLTDMPSNLMTPTIFAENIQAAFRSSCGVGVHVHDKAWIESKCMNSFLAVAKGSSEPPLFVELSYSRGNEKVRPIVLVGKGITFDSGGISIKSSKSMDEMRGDMGGAATCVAALKCISECDIDVNVRVLLPLCENMPSSRAVKPGDVVKAVNGINICVNNTDAEGRLILADALCYGTSFEPRFVTSIATLTGAMRMALGISATGVFSTSDELYDKIEAAGAHTGDRVWRFPFWKEYTDEITKQSGYDLNNIGKGHGGGACVAAAFLKEFVPSCINYMHLDIASVMGPTSNVPYLHKGMTGRPTRTLVEFIRMHSNC